MSLEKSSAVTLTEDDLMEYYDGAVSKRLKTEWNLTLEDLHQIIQSKSYTLTHREKKEVK